MLPVEVSTSIGNWLGYLQLMEDARSVIVMRGLGFGGAWHIAADEHRDMIQEKAPVFAEAVLAGAFTAGWGRGPEQVWQATVRPFARAAGRNRQRLAEAGPKIPFTSNTARENGDTL